MSDRPATRLHVEADLAAGGTVGLSAGQAHFLRAVLRLEPGAAVALFNGRDGEWLARIDGLGKGWGSLAVERQLRAQEEQTDLWLVFAPLKRARIDYLAEKATELGVSALLPVITRRTVVDRVNVERLASTALEAAEQSERLSVPELREPETLDRLLASWPAERRLVFCDETGAGEPIGALAAALEPGRPLAVLIGPEGGFAPAELDALRELPFVSPAALGPRVLRAETAALAALSVMQAMAGDWRRKRSR